MKRPSATKQFGKRLAEFRKSKGLTQIEFGKRIGVSHRVVAYYETESVYPPAHLLAPIAKTLSISIDELIGIKKTDPIIPKSASFWKKILQAENLPHRDRIALLHYLDALLKKKKSASR